MASTAMHFITRVMPIDDTNGKNHKTELKSLNYATCYLWPRGHTHTHTHACVRAYIRRQK